MSSRHLRSETLSLLSPPWNPLSQSPLSYPVHSLKKKGFQTLPKNACSRVPGRNWCRQNRKERVKTYFWVYSRPCSGSHLISQALFWFSSDITGLVLVLI
ncbi:hypothetical protein AAC387_Pa01g1667 [Persea americana]